MAPYSPLAQPVERVAVSTQLPRETADETAGELFAQANPKVERLKDWKPDRVIEGNQQPSPKEGRKTDQREGSETMHLLPKAQAKAKI